MENKHTATATVHINASADKVWEALTNPDMIKQYFFGTNAVSDWKVGSTLEFHGEWEGQEYLDKGVILESEPGKRLKYTYLSSMSGKEDKPENYAEITYLLTADNGGTRLDIIQEGSETEEAKEHSEQNWTSVMTGMKELVEK